MKYDELEDALAYLVNHGSLGGSVTLPLPDYEDLKRMEARWKSECEYQRKMMHSIAQVDKGGTMSISREAVEQAIRDYFCEEIDPEKEVVWL